MIMNCHMPYVSSYLSESKITSPMRETYRFCSIKHCRMCYIKWTFCWHFRLKWFDTKKFPSHRRTKFIKRTNTKYAPHFSVLYLHSLSVYLQYVRTYLPSLVGDKTLFFLRRFIWKHLDCSYAVTTFFLSFSLSLSLSFFLSFSVFFPFSSFVSLLSSAHNFILRSEKIIAWRLQPSNNYYLAKVVQS